MKKSENEMKIWAMHTFHLDVKSVKTAFDSLKITREHVDSRRERLVEAIHLCLWKARILGVIENGSDI